MEASDWDRFLTLVRYHRMAPQAAHTVSTWPNVPPQIAEELTRRARIATRNSLQQAAELTRIVTVLERVEVPVLALKGPTESMLSRGALADRQAIDLDVFIQPEHVLRALLTLQRAGWQVLPDYTGPDGHCHSERDYHCGLSRGHDTPLIELHWRLRRIQSEYPLTVKQALALAETLTVATVAIRTLPLAHRFLYLCVHGSYHRWDQVARLLDIAVYLRQGLPPEVGVLATELGIERSLWLATHLAHRLLEAPLPPWLAKARNPGKALMWLADQTTKRWEQPRHPSQYKFDRWDHLLTTLVLHRNWRDRMETLFERRWRQMAPGDVLYTENNQ